MDNLISGLIGALLATVITVAYSHIAELIRRRHDITLDVVGYCDDVYSRLQAMQVYKNQQAEGKDPSKLDDYRTASRELRDLILSSRVHVRVALVYGEKSYELRVLQALRSHFIESASLLWNSNQNNWNEIHAALFSRFEKQIDPLRLETEIRFVRSVRIRNIVKDLVLNLWPFKLADGKNKSA